MNHVRRQKKLGKIGISHDFQSELIYELKKAKYSGNLGGSHDFQSKWFNLGAKKKGMIWFSNMENDSALLHRLIHNILLANCKFKNQKWIETLRYIENKAQIGYCIQLQAVNVQIRVQITFEL